MISVQQHDFDVGDQYRRLCQQAGDAGAVVFFVGRVRGGDGAVQALELEHYPGMCERQLQGFVDEARRRWDCRAVRLVHRVGRLAAGEQIVFVAVATRHRAECVWCTGSAGSPPASRSCSWRWPPATAPRRLRRPIS